MQRHEVGVSPAVQQLLDNGGVPEDGGPAQRRVRYLCLAWIDSHVWLILPWMDRTVLRQSTELLKRGAAPRCSSSSTMSACVRYLIIASKRVSTLGEDPPLRLREFTVHTTSVITY